jgi:hypothetical protein
VTLVLVEVQEVNLHEVLVLVVEQGLAVMEQVHMKVVE